MSKIYRLILVVFITLLAIPAYCEDNSVMTDDALFKQLKEIENTEFVNINSFMMSMGRMLASGEEKNFLENINSMRIIEFSGCSPEAHSQFIELVSSIELRDYEPAQEEVVGNQRTRVFVKLKNDLIRKIIIAQLGTNEHLIMQINGKLTPEDIERLSKNNPMNK